MYVLHRKKKQNEEAREEAPLSLFLSVTLLHEHQVMECVPILADPRLLRLRLSRLGRGCYLLAEYHGDCFHLLVIIGLLLLSSPPLNLLRVPLAKVPKPHTARGPGRLLITGPSLSSLLARIACSTTGAHVVFCSSLCLGALNLESYSKRTPRFSAPSRGLFLKITLLTL